MTYSLQIPSIMHKTMFGNLLHDFHKIPKRKSFPITDVYRDDNDNQVIEMALAGYNKDLIKIEVRSNQITISSAGADSKRESNIASFITDTDWDPYITTIGLYDDSARLLAVGKLSRPLRKDDGYDTTIEVRFDT